MRRPQSDGKQDVLQSALDVLLRPHLEAERPSAGAWPGAPLRYSHNSITTMKKPTHTGATLPATTCSRSLSESKIEEIITALWAIVWATLWGAGAPTWVLWIFGIKAASDYMCVIWFAIREIRDENATVEGTG